MILTNYFQKKAKEYEIPFWKLPDFLMLVSGLINGLIMIITYWWSVDFMEDPREAVLIVAVESLLILLITNVIVESSKKIMDSGKLKKEFIDIISHQIRTPLTSIKWSVEALKNNRKKKGADNLRDEELTDQIAVSTERIMDLLSDFFYLSKIKEEESQNKSVLSKGEKINTSDTIKDVIKNNAYLAKGKKVEVVFNDKCKMILNSDISRLKLILDNLIDNAIKYSFSGGKVNIKVKKEAGSYFLFSITNHGCEIEEKDRKYIFNKFFRSKNAVKMNSSGTGLGLYICKSLTETIGGKIWFFSSKNKTTFYLKLPLS